MVVVVMVDILGLETCGRSRRPQLLSRTNNFLPIGEYSSSNQLLSKGLTYPGRSCARSTAFRLGVNAANNQGLAVRSSACLPCYCIWLPADASVAGGSKPA